MHPPFPFHSFPLKITLHVSIPFVPQKFAWRGARKQGARKETIIAGREEGREAKSLCLCPAINRRKRRASRGVSFQPLRCLSMSVPPIADLYTTEIYCRAPSIRAIYLRTFCGRGEGCLLQFGPIFHFSDERGIFVTLSRNGQGDKD